MGKTKKVILFIVEGITDKTALGTVLDAILSNEKIHFAITKVQPSSITPKQRIYNTHCKTYKPTMLKKS